MIDGRLLVAVGAGLAGLALVAYLVYRWSKLKDWAATWLANHRGFRKVICSVEALTVDYAAAVKRGANNFKMKVFGVANDGTKKAITTELRVSVDKIEEYKRKCREDPLLATI